MRRAVLVVNPFASQVTDERVEAVRAELERGASVETLFTERPGHAVELVEAVTDVDAIFVFSGDGGFNEALNGADGRVPLGFLPGGGTSVLPRVLGLPRDPVAAAHRLGESLAAGRTRSISVGRANGRRFGFACGVGLDAEVVRRVDALGRGRDGRRPGDLSFARVVAGTLLERRGRLDPVLEVRGLGRAAFAIVGNADPYTYAGALALHATPLARLEEGLDVVAPVLLRPAAIARLVGHLLLRGRGLERARGVLYAHDRDRIEIVCDRPLPVHVDGEDLGDLDRVEAVCERGAVDVLV
jgi:diacylglycerol kinase family enzyme